MSERQKSHQPVVAILEDDDDIRWLLDEFAQDAGFGTHTYATNEEALSSLATSPADVIIADCVGCGYLAPTDEDRARLAQLSRFAPTILHTARSWALAPALTANLGVAAVVPKPTDFSVLQQALDRAIGRR